MLFAERTIRRILTAIKESTATKWAIVVYATLLAITGATAAAQNYCQWTGCNLPQGVISIDPGRLGMVAATAATATAFLLTLHNVQVNFWRRREHVPHLTMALTVQRTEASPSTNVLTATLDAKNTGNALCQINEMSWVVRVIAPYDDPRVATLRASFDAAVNDDPLTRTEFPWDPLEFRTTHHALDVEPGEADQVTEDFLVPPEATTVAVAVYVHNASEHGADG